MRIDVVSIFPDFFAPLDLSLVGKARRSGLLDVRVHDLRTWTHDRHRTVDDTPYGGGAGMVMRPEPWGEALDDIAGSAEPDPVLVVPTPSGEPFTQETAQRLAGADWLLLACGRYEGIDERVMEHARGRMEVRELSLGDYVLNGGEVAALAVIEAVVRLLPNFMGNPESLTEESHGHDRLLEYPVYTKPPTWRGLDVPEVLLGGDHGKVAAWRHAQAVRRTAERRPDLLHPSQRLALPDLGTELPAEAEIRLAVPADAPEILTLQRACLLPEPDFSQVAGIPALREGLDDVTRSLGEFTTVVVRAGHRLIGSARGRLAEDTWEIERIMVVPDLQGGALDHFLLEHLESMAPQEASRLCAVTDPGHVRDFRRAGYRPAGPAAGGEVRLVKRHR
ncbi:MAG TPA: tRNA (guanosine(37)-N1)-methyltransferase TrmD [Nocardioidaceae bacterium]|nr:tRNA (guanosine(37)-N1)-methyltransferase TrmD [Nocardioidaceae bacterium]